jgi:hypothetical protein
MVLRLLTFNAEVWLAEHFNTYLAGPDEYRAITRNLLHQSGQIEYDTSAINVTLDRPDSPRIARALHLLTDELNHTPTRLPGDPRPFPSTSSRHESQQSTQLYFRSSEARRLMASDLSGQRAFRG